MNAADLASLREGLEHSLGVLPVEGAGGVRVLVADDEPFIRVLIEATLRAAGYPHVAFPDGAPALAAFQAAPEAWSVLITDDKMDDLHGFDLIDRVRAARPGFPVILVSGLAHPAYCAQAKVWQVLKPFTPEDILSALSAVTRPATP